MTLAAFAATGIAIAGISAVALRRDPTIRVHRAALRLALWVAVPASLLQVVSGDLSAKFVAEHQPVKLAAMEGHFETARGAALRIGGIPDEAAGVTRYAIEVPTMLSVLAFGDPDAEVKGLEAVPRDEWPPVLITHLAFQVMVGIGTLMAIASLWVVMCWVRRRDVVADRRLLTLLAWLMPAGFIAVEAGWVVTEVGRQPWIIQGVMRTADAVTPMPGLAAPFALFTLLYLFLGTVVCWLLWTQIVKGHADA